MSVPNPQYSDKTFLEGLRSGNNEVLKALYKKYYPFVLKFVVNNSGTQEAAQDIYQESIIVLYENAQDSAFNLHCQLQTYIYSVARRLWLKQLRKSGNTYLMREEEEFDLVDVSEDVEKHKQREEELEKLSQSLSGLGEPCAALLKDYYVQRMSMEDLAEKFGYTNADNAKNQKYKCLQRLKRLFFTTGNLEEKIRL